MRIHRKWASGMWNACTIRDARGLVSDAGEAFQLFERVRNFAAEFIYKGFSKARRCLFLAGARPQGARFLPLFSAESGTSSAEVRESEKLRRHQVHAFVRNLRAQEERRRGACSCFLKWRGMGGSG